MARIFLDANYFIDLVEERKKEVTLSKFLEDQLFISSLSVHILTYLYKYKIPHKGLGVALKKFNVIDFGKQIVATSLLGPTTDFEDNVQLHSAVEAECNIFLTNDVKLLNLKFFGKTRIDSKIDYEN